jgi:hypothetical protein
METVSPNSVYCSEVGENTPVAGVCEDEDSVTKLFIM